MCYAHETFRESGAKNKYTVLPFSVTFVGIKWFSPQLKTVFLFSNSKNLLAFTRRLLLDRTYSKWLMIIDDNNVDTAGYISRTFTHVRSCNCHSGLPIAGFSNSLPLPTEHTVLLAMCTQRLDVNPPKCPNLEVMKSRNANIRNVIPSNWQSCEWLLSEWHFTRIFLTRLVRLPSCLSPERVNPRARAWLQARGMGIFVSKAPEHFLRFPRLFGIARRSERH